MLTWYQALFSCLCCPASEGSEGMVRTADPNGVKGYSMAWAMAPSKKTLGEIRRKEGLFCHTHSFLLCLFLLSQSRSFLTFTFPLLFAIPPGGMTEWLCEAQLPTRANPQPFYPPCQLEDYVFMWLDDSHLTKHTEHPYFIWNLPLTTLISFCTETTHLLSSIIFWVVFFFLF